MSIEDFKRRRPSLYGYFVSGLAGAVVGGFLLLSFGPAALFDRFNQPQPEVTPQALQLDQQLEQSSSFRQLRDMITSSGGDNTTFAAQRVIPSVVGIVTTQIEMTSYFSGKRVQGVGSGVIIDKDGYILTNNHVASKNATSIRVSLADGRATDGRVIWADPILDLAIVKIDLPNLTVATMGDSRNVRVGEDAIAIGNPLGLRFQRSVTAGIISAVNRTIEVEPGVVMEDLIQTDASINPGNSGGPLLNSRGEVVAINTIKVVSAEGMGFAIPINVIKPVIKSIRDSGAFKTPVLGAVGYDREIAGYKVDGMDGGVLLDAITDGSPAHKAGLKKGDVIVSVDGANISTMIEFREKLYSIGCGKDIKLKIKDAAGNIRDAVINLVEGK